MEMDQGDAIDRLANHTFVEMPGHPRTCWACSRPKRDHDRPDTRERGPVVEFDLADILRPAQVDGPPRATRKHAP